jgi:hypothetical protein
LQPRPTKTNDQGGVMVVGYTFRLTTTIITTIVEGTTKRHTWQQHEIHRRKRSQSYVCRFNQRGRLVRSCRGFESI